MKTPDEIKRGLKCCLSIFTDCQATRKRNERILNALAYIQQLERENAQKDERILQLGMINAEYKHVLGYIKHAADMGVHGDADVLAQFGINMGRRVEEGDDEG